LKVIQAESSEGSTTNAHPDSQPNFKLGRML